MMKIKRITEVLVNVRQFKPKRKNTKISFLSPIAIKRKHQPNGWCFSFAVGHPTEMNSPSNTKCCVVDATPLHYAGLHFKYGCFSFCLFLAKDLNLRSVERKRNHRSDSVDASVKVL